ncbi:hypothetical protein T4B_6953 [Trichinella pseudospiralis]|uniref:Uncharacterized protein n=1 Tax=Trichinella pseudospiralis TaxID=6337 RepID=A0A0V1IQY7_TRIPS|nr:hypothetical protein T4A_4977 [Trichinella pseudospiralis]KRZ25200.1 hypothetical protein T4B_6953 [Trichinella pseudospiralis]
MNFWPSSAISSCAVDNVALTLAHFFIGKELLSLPSQNSTGNGGTSGSCWSIFVRGGSESIWGCGVDDGIKPLPELMEIQENAGTPTQP